MRIVDLRPGPVRRLTAAWQRRPEAVSPGPAALATRLADCWQARRAAARPEPPAGTFIVSVGNLALGGTGKTPVTVQLALDLAAAGLSGAVLTRGYGSPLAGPLPVVPETARAGDEARLLAAALAGTGWRVVQARRRARGLAWLQGQGKLPDVILVEDGHQTPGVGRHLDILILDRWRVAGEGASSGLHPVTGAVAPFGPWRESAAGADRAGIWLVETASPPAGAEGRLVAGFSRRSRLTGAAPAADGGVALLSGIARPEPFEQQAAAQLDRAPALAIRCRDHEPYDGRMLARIETLLAEAGVASVVTTAKDHVKLGPVWGDRPPLRVLTLQVSWEGMTALPELVRERLDAVRRGVAGV